MGGRGWAGWGERGSWRDGGVAFEGAAEGPWWGAWQMQCDWAASEGLAAEEVGEKEGRRLEGGVHSKNDRKLTPNVSVV